MKLSVKFSAAVLLLFFALASTNASNLTRFQEAELEQAKPSDNRREDAEPKSQSKSDQVSSAEKEVRREFSKLAKLFSSGKIDELEKRMTDQTKVEFAIDMLFSLGDLTQEVGELDAFGFDAGEEFSEAQLEIVDELSDISDEHGLSNLELYYSDSIVTDAQLDATDTKLFKALGDTANRQMILGGITSRLAKLSDSYALFSEQVVKVKVKKDESRVFVTFDKGESDGPIDGIYVFVKSDSGWIWDGFDRSSLGGGFGSDGDDFDMPAMENDQEERPATETKPKTEVAGEVAPAPLDWQALESRLIESASKAFKATVAVMYPGEEGLGAASAVLVSEDGLIMTAGHVVDTPGSELTIALSDGRRFKARGLGLEPDRDCGLIQIDKEALNGEKLPFAEMGWSSKLKPGQPVFSFGNGEYKSDRGAYLRFGRVVSSACTFRGMIESTCMMEPGDSGGPLFDIDGKVIGVRSMILQSLDQNFDVPVDIFRHYWTALHQPKKFRWGKLEHPVSFGLKFTVGRAARSIKGVRISKTEDNGWAASQGLLAKDRIQSWDGDNVTRASQLHMKMIHSLLARQTAVKVSLKRGDEIKELTVDFSGLNSKIQDPIATFSDQSPESEPVIIENFARSFSATEEKLDDYTVVLEKNEVTGTLVRLPGQKTSWVVAQSSEVKGDTQTVLFEDETKQQAQVVSRSLSHNLVLLKLEQQPAGYSGVELTVPADAELQRGMFLLSPSPEDGGDASSLSSLEFDSRGHGFLGVAPGDSDKGFVIKRVTPDSPAAKFGLKEGDQLLAFDGTELEDFQEAVQFLRQTKGGQTVDVRLLRDGVKMEKKVTLTTLPEDDVSDFTGGHVADVFKGGKSDKLMFPSVFLHDSRVEAAECGGPVFDVAGKRLIGINIARVSRTRTYLLPTKVIADFVKQGPQKSQ